MIAVFTKRQEEFDRLNSQPENVFIRIKDTSTIMGRKFTGVITMYNWYENIKLEEAYEALIESQPELFK